MNSKHVYRQYWIYFFAIMMSMIGINLFIYTQGWYVLDISSSKLSVGLAWSIFFTPGLLVLPILGSLLDSQYIKKVLILCEFARAFVLIVFMVILYFVPKVYLVYLMSGCFGLFFSTFYPSIYVVLKKIVPQDMVAKYSHMIELSVQIGSSISILISGFLYKYWGFFPLVGLGAGLIVLSGIMLSMLDIGTTSTKGIAILEEYKNFFKIFGQVWKTNKEDRKVYLFGIGHQFPQNVIMSANIPVLLYVYAVMHKTPVEYGILDSLVGVAAMCAGIFWTKYYTQSQTRNIVLLMPLFAAISFAFIAVIPPYGIIPYVLFMIMALFMTSAKIQSRAAVIRSTPTDVMGRFTSLYQTVSYTFTLILAFVLSDFCQHINVQKVFLILAGTMAIYVWFLSWVYKQE